MCNHYVVTGGAGFIGSSLIERLLKDNADTLITCIDNFDPFYSREIKENNITNFTKEHVSRFRLLEIDLVSICASQLRELIPDKITAIIHLAGKAGVRPSIDDPIAYHKANIIALQNMLDFAHLAQVKQFVFASSSSVYGVNSNYPWRENEQLMPISPYAMTKLAGEMLGHVYHKLYNIRFIALRFFTVYGPKQRPDLAIHKFMRAIMTDQPITAYGDGNASRDYTYIDDIVDGIIKSIHYDRSDYEIINLGNNYTITLNDLISEIEVVTGKKAIVKRVADVAGDVPKTMANIDKAKDLLGYNPQTSLQEGLKRFYIFLSGTKCR
jgi:UDP-glucuronate 4-epimerase